MENTNNNRPLVLLDVDGVINDLDALVGIERPWGVTTIASNGFALHIPDYMPDLVCHLTRTCEVWWCTTWRDRANNEIAEYLGIESLPVVTDGSQSRSVGWKAAAARGLVVDALAAGRPAYWIEDFYGSPPAGELPGGVVYIDTTADEPRCVLTKTDLPEELHALLHAEPSTAVAISGSSS